MINNLVNKIVLIKKNIFHISIDMLIPQQRYSFFLNKTNKIQKKCLKTQKNIIK